MLPLLLPQVNPFLLLSAWILLQSCTSTASYLPEALPHTGEILLEHGGMWEHWLPCTFSATTSHASFVELPCFPQARAIFRSSSRIACPAYRKMRYLVWLMLDWCTSYRTAKWKISSGLPSSCTGCEEEDSHYLSVPKQRKKKSLLGTSKKNSFSSFCMKIYISSAYKHKDKLDLK